ncbi:peptidase inhibitor family I36 protein [Streptomyces sp. NBC_00094]|uniref:peptidase inhibitor family I36 protein n=1 Tax=Streptomyces sp. NBC_00094 TaxID=2903620 RepID=UPI00225077AA|nr:peptidase inhibitor family I36 protein [Streptomyces sp. NBC_00094]MCX5390395.1 peptidase inhibitor family I36 protein [Streptomyces sp. NBC_00094]
MDGDDEVNQMFGTTRTTGTTGNGNGNRGRVRLGLAAAFSALAMTVSLGAGTARAADPWAGCYSGDVCVYTGLNGTGSVCAWSGGDNNWSAGPITCSWTLTKNVKSIWNRGTGGVGTYRHVDFFLAADYTSFYACAAQGFKGNTGPDAGAPIRSHYWTDRCDA